MTPFHFGLEGTRRAADLGNYLAARREELMPEPHLYLVALGVDPKEQGRSLGRALLRPVLERADGDMTLRYLETFLERTASFYSRLGFEVVAKTRRPARRVYVLVHEKRAAGVRTCVRFMREKARRAA